MFGLLLPPTSSNTSILSLAAHTPGGAAATTSLDGRSLQQLFAVLKEHAEGVRQLQEVLKRDQLDLQIIKQQS